MNKDDVAGLVERLRGWKAQYRGDADEGTIPLAAKAADALTTLSARVETLEAALRASVEYMEFRKTQNSEPGPLARCQAALAGDTNHG